MFDHGCVVGIDSDNYIFHTLPWFASRLMVIDTYLLSRFPFCSIIYKCRRRVSFPKFITVYVEGEGGRHEGKKETMLIVMVSSCCGCRRRVKCFCK